MTPDQFRRVEELFDEVAALPAGQRPAILALHDPEIRAEVESLLAADDDAAGKLAGIISGIANEDGLEGRRIGPYRAIREIGRGGMGVVFEGAREGDFSQRVALKLSTLAVYSPDFLERFRQERQILAGLTHPFIARLIDGGSTADGVPFIAMEFVDGVSIRDYAKREKLSPDSCCRLFLKVCEAVEYAHQNLIVHRDLKPANVLINERGDPKLLDFGVAKLLDAGPGMTATSLGPATPEYSAPEQILGHAITTRTDVYQLGLILYEILAGHRAQSVPGTSLRAIQRTVCELEIEPLRLGGDLATIVATAVQKDPARRYPSVTAFADDIRAFLAGRPIAALRDSRWYRARKFVRRNWLMVAAAALLSVTLLGGIAATLYQARRAERRFAQVRGIARALLYDVHESVQTLPASINAQQVVVRTALQYLDGLATEVGNDAGLQREVAAGYSRIGTIQARMVGPSLDQRDSGLASFSKAAGILAPMQNANPGQIDVAVELADIYSTMAEIAARTTRTAEASKLAEQAIAVMEAVALRHPENPFVRRRLAKALVMYNRDIAGREKPKLDFVVRSVTEMEAVLALMPQDQTVRDELAQAYLAAGTVCFNGKDSASARNYFEKAVLFREDGVRAQPGNAVLLRALMLAYAALGDVHWGFPHSLGNRKEAIASFQKMFAAASKQQAMDPNGRSARLDYAFSQMRYGSALPPGDKQALALLGESLTTLEAVAGIDAGNAGLRRQMIDLCIRKGQRHAELGQSGVAIEHFKKGAHIADALATADSKNLSARTWGLRATFHLAQAYEKSSRRALSVALLPKARQFLQEAQALDAASAAPLANQFAEWERRLR
ncbi:MAG: protein kinase [Bryobacterales bacterium]|nr:protein kinase [Bryobacterales bacterium]